MTDLISKLADSILALINAQPRSPTKAEIMEVFHKTVGKIDAPQVMVNFDWLQALSQRAQVAIPPDIAGSVGILPLRAEDRDRATAKRWADMFKADLERTSFEIMHRGSPGTEKDRENGGLSSLWGAQDAANPHPEATQAARETYTYTDARGMTVETRYRADPVYNDCITTQDGRTLNVKVTEELANALGIPPTPHSDGEYLADDGSAVFADPGMVTCYVGSREEPLRVKWSEPNDASSWNPSAICPVHTNMQHVYDGYDVNRDVSVCACGATEPDKC